MSEERLLSPDVAEKDRTRLAEIRATLPHWGGGTHRRSPEAEATLTANLGETLGKIMAGISARRVRCHVCGALERREGKRTVIEHDFAKHPQGEIPASQLDVKPVHRSRASDESLTRLGLSMTSVGGN
jgi:hypothetical protein